MIHSEILLDIADTLDLSFFHSTNLVSARYLNNSEDLNSIINLIFLRPNSVELDNHLILSELQFSSDYAPLVVNIQIIKEFVPITKRTIIKNSKEEWAFSSEIINEFKKIDLSHLTSKKMLESVVQKFANVQE